MNEITWGMGHDDQLRRQLKWQEVRNEFYSNLCYECKNAAAHVRANDMRGFSAGQSDSIDRAISKTETRQAECMDASEYYHRVVCVHDQAIKQAARTGDADLHKKLLDDANAIIKGILERTNLAISYHEI